MAPSCDSSTGEEWERIRHTWTKEMAMDPDGGSATPATESPDNPSPKAQDVPLGFLDTLAGRKWYCAHVS